MKKILFVESYPHVMFGQQRILLNMLDSRADIPLEPIVAVTAEGPFVDEVRRRSIPVVFFPYPELLKGYGGAIYSHKGLRWLRALWQVFAYIRRIRRELRALALDGVYCNDMRGLLTAGIAARSLGLPVLIWDKLDKSHGWMDWFQLPLVKMNLIISNAVTRKYPAWQKALMKKKIALVYEGAEVERFDKAKSIRKNLGFGDKDVLLAIVGTITERKGQDRILALWPQLSQQFPNLRLLVVGATAGTEEDEKYVTDLPNRDHSAVRFLGMREDIPELMRSIDILLVPSRQEGFGLVIVEAMAASLPVIGANTGGIPEVIIHEKTGLVVNGKDSQAWIEAISRLVDSKESRTKMGKAGRQRVEKEFYRPAQMEKVLQACLDMTNDR